MTRLPKVIRDHMTRMGRAGGKARARALSPEQRQAISRKGQRALRKKLREQARKDKAEAAL